MASDGSDSQYWKLRLQRWIIGAAGGLMKFAEDD
jgi:hypothetical protein